MQRSQEIQMATQLVLTGVLLANCELEADLAF
jgi:hypothetical protein